MENDIVNHFKTKSLLIITASKRGQRARKRGGVTHEAVGVASTAENLFLSCANLAPSEWEE